LHPFVAAVMLLGLCVAAVLAATFGPMRASVACAGGLCLAAILCSSATTSDNRHRWVALERGVGCALLAVYAVGAYAIERLLPLRLVLTSSHPTATFLESERCTLQVTSGQGEYHLFVNAELRFSTFDDRRWSESLVRPALARSQHPRRALVLSTGEGLIERELLKDPEIASVTSVARCDLVPAFARQSAWLKNLTHDAMNSARVSIQQRDPLAFLVNSPLLPYDVVIVDLPDPAGPLESKYYSRYFYQQLFDRMHDGSILVVQATSARRSPRTFATIGATMQAAGFSIEGAFVPLISRGEWSLYLAAKGNVPAPMRPEWLHDTLASSIPGQFAHPWPDTLPPAGFSAEPSLLYDAKVFDWFEYEANGFDTTSRTTVPNHMLVSARPPNPNRPSQAAQNAPAPSPCKILAVGDSLTDPRSSGGGYLEALRSQCDCQITNLGKGGAMVNQMRARLLTHLAETTTAYTYVVVFGGVNDLYSDVTARRTLAQIKADLETMYRAARQRGARVVAITVTPWGGFRRYFTEHRWQNTLELNRWIRRGQESGLIDFVLDGERLLSCDKPERLCDRYAAPFRDGLHFGPVGHQRLAQALVQALGSARCRGAPDGGSNDD
jgi:spermidine synthase/lysophospholipase L1-like esterase